MPKKMKSKGTAEQSYRPLEALPAYSQPPPASMTEGWMLDAFSDDPLNEQQSGTTEFERRIVSVLFRASGERCNQ
jgi:hypothetical protein